VRVGEGFSGQTSFEIARDRNATKKLTLPKSQYLAEVTRHRFWTNVWPCNDTSRNCVRMRAT